MKRSPLHDTHVRLGARFLEFGGWEMPARYDSVLAEHRAVRSGAGFFDVTHLGRFELTGRGAHAAVRKLLCNDIDRIEPGRCQYTMILNPEGGIIDDMIVWWWDESCFWVLPNAANQERVMGVFTAEPDCELADLQTKTAMIAVQGPSAGEVLDEIVGEAPGRFRTTSTVWKEGHLTMAGTGYTGEVGGEVVTDSETAVALVDALVEQGVVPCGLEARDTLRLEAGLTLWGADIDETTTPLEAGLDFAVDLDHEFVGRERLVDQAENGVSRKLTGLVLEERGVPRAGYRVRTSSGGEGTVTSGNMSPMIDKGVALAYIGPPPEDGERVEIEIRNRWVAGRVAEPPFHETES
jgi:aminomethyltransferase